MLKDENPHRPRVQRTASEAHRTAPKSLEPGQNLVRGRQVLVRDGIRTHAGRVPVEHLVHLLPERQPLLGSTHPDRSPIMRGALLDQVIILHHLRSEEHTSELQSLMRISYAVFCLKKKNNVTK